MIFLLLQTEVQSDCVGRRETSRGKLKRRGGGAVLTSRHFLDFHGGSALQTGRRGIEMEITFSSSLLF